MQSTPEYTRNRFKFIAGMMKQRIYSDVRPVQNVLVSDEAGRVSFAAAQELSYRPVERGEQFGPLWSSYWFQGNHVVPEEWTGKRLDLIWNSGSEGLLYINGRSIQGLNYGGGDGRFDAVLTRCAQAGQVLDFQVEMACNGLFGEQVIHPFKSISTFVFDQCDIGVFDPLAHELYYDFQFLVDLEADLAREGSTGDRALQGELLYKLNKVCNVYDQEDRATWAGALSMLKELFKFKNGTSAHELSAIGHAHIDTAWLWPLAETHRKCMRTFSTAVSYMDEYPEYTFAVSSSYQYQVIKEQNPDLYARIKEKIANGQFIPVGGTFVEPDCNLPSGENLARQFLFGQRFFQSEFGITSREFWEPDVFGYNGQLPQIMRLSGIDRFLTQKLSWNQFNPPRFSTFWWEGQDGSKVLTHFPPADTYNATANIEELRRNVRSHKEHGRSNHSLLLYGWGDGGGGPSKKHIEYLRRAKDMQGLPRTTMRSPQEFFDTIARESVELPKMVGELYFELHRGTLTTQGWIKRKMRKSEVALHNAEFLSAIASRLHGVEYPHDTLREAWELVLINDFHDILPGSSIALVNEVAWEQLDQAIAGATELERRASGILVPAGKSKAKGKRKSGATTVHTPINTTDFDRREVSETPDGCLVVAEAPRYGVGVIGSGPAPEDEVTVIEFDNLIILQNNHLHAILNTRGDLVSLTHKATGREALTAPGNRLQLHEDRPTTRWDAWDCDPHHLENVSDCPPASEYSVSASSLRAEVTFTRAIGKRSKLVQTVRLDAESQRLEFHTEVDWHENHQFLKAMFPVNVRAQHATYDMQFGATERPTHQNTTADLAKWEVCGHKWADMSEHGFGVAILSESKYGFSALDNELRISLLRSPKYPDDQADMGQHTFAYAIYPHAGGWREAGVVAEGYKFNMPLLWATGDKPVEPVSYASVDDANLVIDTIKGAEDSDAIVVRMYEANGARGKARLKVGFPFTSARLCNILEEDGQQLEVINGEVVFDYKPAQIISIKLA